MMAPSCFSFPLFSHTQRVVRVDSLFSLRTIFLPATQPLHGRGHQCQSDALNPAAFPGLFGLVFGCPSL